MEKDIERNIAKKFARKSERSEEFAGKDVSHFWKEAQLSGHRIYIKRTRDVHIMSRTPSYERFLNFQFSLCVHRLQVSET